MRLAGGVSDWLQLNGEFAGIAGWLNVQVVDEPGPAEKDCQHRVAWASDARDRLERVGVHDLRVIDGGERLGFHPLAQDCLQVQRIAPARGEVPSRPLPPPPSAPASPPLSPP